MDYNDRKLCVAIVAQELADIDPSTLKFGEWPEILNQAKRKLAYWLEQPVFVLALDDAQEALCDLEQCADGTDLEHEGLGTGYTHEEWRAYFNEQYETAVIDIIGINTEVN